MPLLSASLVLLAIEFGSDTTQSTPALHATIAATPVEITSAASTVDGASVYRTDFVPEGQTGGVTVQAVDNNLLETLGGSVAEGQFLDEANSGFPTVVLGSVAAERLGVRSLDNQPAVWLGDEWFSVIGILDEFELSPDLDRAALVGMGAAADFLGDDNVPTSIYVRTDPKFVEDVMRVMAATANPETPEEIEVDRPSDALEAREAADDAFTSLFLGLGGVVLLVGGVGIANVMVISVLERRSEIGLRRAKGATRLDIYRQILGEILIIATLGLALGGLVLVQFPLLGWLRFLDFRTYALAFVASAATTYLLAALCGLYPSWLAARIQPAEALHYE